MHTIRLQEFFHWLCAKSYDFYLQLGPSVIITYEIAPEFLHASHHSTTARSSIKHLHLKAKHS